MYSRLLAPVLIATAVTAACCSAEAPAGAPAATSGPRPTASSRTAGASAATPVGSSPARLPIGGCPVFPADHAFHARVDGLPVRADSPVVTGAPGPNRAPLRAGFTAGVWEGSRVGIPVNVVDGSTARRADFVVASAYFESSGTARLGVPMPADPRFEGWPGRAWDKHLLVVDTDTCTTREMINVMPPGENLTAGGNWYADAVGSFDLRSNRPAARPVTASGVSMLAGMVRYDEVASGALHHAVGMALPETRHGSHLWPAMGTDGRSTSPGAPVLGSWFRLRADADLSGLGPQARVIAKALQRHGAVAVDSGGHAPTLGGEPDERWDDRDLAGLGRFSLRDFELVDAAGLRDRPDSFRIRPGA